MADWGGANMWSVSSQILGCQRLRKQEMQAAKRNLPWHEKFPKATKFQTFQKSQAIREDSAPPGLSGQSVRLVDKIRCTGRLVALGFCNVFWGPFDVCAWTSHLWDSCGCWVNRRIPESHKCRDSESLADKKFASKARFIAVSATFPCNTSLHSNPVLRWRDKKTLKQIPIWDFWLCFCDSDRKKTVNTLRLKGFQKNVQGLPA